MKTLVINANDSKELRLLQSIAQKMGLEAQVLTDEQQEEAGLLRAMLEGQKEEYVDEEEVMKALRK